MDVTWYTGAAEADDDASAAAMSRRFANNETLLNVLLCLMTPSSLRGVCSLTQTYLALPNATRAERPAVSGTRRSPIRGGVVPVGARQAHHVGPVRLHHVEVGVRVLVTGRGAHDAQP